MRSPYEKYQRMSITLSITVLVHDMNFLTWRSLQYLARIASFFRGKRLIEVVWYPNFETFCIASLQLQSINCIVVEDLCLFSALQLYRERDYIHITVYIPYYTKLRCSKNRN